MTTIVWDGKTLAADRQMTWGKSTRTECTKVFKVTKKGVKYLIGSCGHPAPGDRFLKHFRKHDIFEKLEDYDDCETLVIREDGHIWFVESGYKVTDLVASKWAIGSGGDYAMGAMKMGATAKQAVEVSMTLDINTGLGIDTVKF